MAKLRGEQRWERKDVISEMIALEIDMDASHQKDLPVRNGRVIPFEEWVAFELGRVRSIAQRTGIWEQMTLKRWTKPAPNQVAVEPAKRTETG